MPNQSAISSNHLILCHLLVLHSIFPASQSFPRSQFFASGAQSIGVSASAWVLPMNIQGWFLWGLTGLISLLSKRCSRVFSSTTVRKHQFFGAQPSLWPILTSLHDHWKKLCLYGPLSAKWYPCFLIHCLGLSQLFSPGASIFYFMTVVTICSDFGTQENKILSLFPPFPLLFAMKRWDWMPWS